MTIGITIDKKGKMFYLFRDMFVSPLNTNEQIYDFSLILIVKSGPFHSTPNNVKR